MFSIKLVAPPKSAITHIQNNAPGPPTATAIATPARLPVPTWEATAIQNAWNPVTWPATFFSPSLREESFPVIRATISPNNLPWAKPVLIVYNSPDKIKSAIRT